MFCDAPQICPGVPARSPHLTYVKMVDQYLLHLSQANCEAYTTCSGFKITQKNLTFVQNLVPKPQADPFCMFEAKNPQKFELSTLHKFAQVPRRQAACKLL